MIYEVENGKEDEIEEDIKLIAEALQMLQYDYLGGSGSRGYGKVKFHELNAENVVGEIDTDIMERVNNILQEI